MKRAALRLTVSSGFEGRARLAGLCFGLLAGVACNVETLPDASRPAVANSCTANADCGSNGVCTNGACYSRTGRIDEVLLEIVPEATSPLGGISFLSMQGGLERGARDRAIALTGPVTFPVQVQVNGEDLAKDCPYLKTGKQTVAARIEFTRTGSVGGVPVAGLSSRFSLSVDTEQNTSTSTSGFSKNVALVPGFYDIYAQPVAYPNCQIPPKRWRGVEVARDGQVGWAPPTTLDCAAPARLNGRVSRTGGPLASLADWQVDLIDPQDGKVISTSARLGATTDASPLTNFEITYQPPELAGPAAARQPKPGAPGPLIRLRPPKDAESTSAVVYFDLSVTDLGNTGQVKLDLSSLPAADRLVTVSGQVRGSTTNEGVRSTVKFFNSTFQGLTAAFGPAVTTDAEGRYSTKLFPANTYRVVVVPDGASDNGTTVSGASVTRRWALTVRQQLTIGSDPSQVVDLMVIPTRSLEGMASAGRADVPAQGATLEATPIIESSSDVLQTVIKAPVSPARASVPVDDTNGQFKLVLDPGYYDLLLKPAPASNFAWWILPDVHVLTEPTGDELNPRLLYPVPLEGTITVTLQDRTAQPVRNATVQVYARTQESVVQVGTARTDDTGHYYVALPPDFGAIGAP